MKFLMVIVLITLSSPHLFAKDSKKKLPPPVIETSPVLPKAGNEKSIMPATKGKKTKGGLNQEAPGENAGSEKGNSAGETGKP